MPLVQWTSSYPSIEKVAQAFDGAQYVEYNDVTSLFYVWNGSLGVQVFNDSLDEVDMFSLECPAEDVYDVKESISEHNDYLMRNYE